MLGGKMPAKPVTDEGGWKTVSETEVDENKIVFDTIGDVFIGTYLGDRTVTNADGSYRQFRFRGTDDGVYFVNANYSLQRGMENVRVGRMCRLTYIEDKDVGQRSPLRIFKVDVR